jgi:FkbM family methyltransferase
MIFGINTPLLTARPRQKSGSLGAEYETIAQIGVKSIRLPLLWSFLRGDGDPLNDSAVEMIEKIIEGCPETCDILAYVYNPAGREAELFFKDPTAFAKAFADFCGALASRFRRISAWEIWNEPNASDFYLSVADGERARHWTPAEFVDHVLLPGGRAIRAVRPNDPICIAGLAEDGIVGHSRQPALSNRLPRTPKYNRLRSSEPHGNFYFIPDFLDGLTRALDARREEVLRVFSAAAFHPYPYFKIHERPNKAIVPATKQHVEDFLERIEGSVLSELQVWITEFGARSLVIDSDHFNDENQQLVYAEECLEFFGAQGKIDRAYWYHYKDTLWDLRQEKTFGLVDFYGNKRPTYFLLKRLAHQQPEGHHTGCVDDFGYAKLFRGTGFDPATWDSRANTIFGYTLGSESNGQGCVFVSPGRRVGDHVAAALKRPFYNPAGSPLDVALELSLSSEGGTAEVALVLAHENGRTLDVGIEFGTTVAARVRVDGEEVLESFSDEVTELAAQFEVSGATWRFERDRIVVKLLFGDIGATFVTESVPSLDPGAWALSIKIARRSSEPAFVGLQKFQARLGGEEVSWLDRPANADVLGAGNWLIDLPAYSQIHQDEWVLRCLKFKRDGFFLEVGGHDGVENSNTYLLEKRFDWDGVIVEANPRWHKVICRNRNVCAVNAAAFSTTGQELQFVDVGAVGGLVACLQDDIHDQKRRTALADGHVISVTGKRVDEILRQVDAPRLIDYASIDTEGSEVEVLRSIDFAFWRIALLTVEHAGNEDKRKEIWDILQPHGYIRYRVWFEDWFVHEAHLAEALAVDTSVAMEHLGVVMSRERYHKRQKLVTSGNQKLRSGAADEALGFFAEAAKSYYPNNMHPVVESIRLLRRSEQIGAADKVAFEAMARFSRNTWVLKECLVQFLSSSRPVKVNELMKLLGPAFRQVYAEDAVRQAFADFLARNKSPRPEHTKAMAAIRDAVGRLGA